MQKLQLKNGLKVIYEHKVGHSVVIEVMIKVGSNNELPDEKGISHFLEHMLFEGTKKRPTNRDITNEIEKIGGEFNAYTSNERTCFYVKVLKKHFPIAVEILSDILKNSLFQEKDIEREKKVILKEIDMVNDEPRYYQWVLLQSTIFKKHPARFPTYGNKKVIRNLNRDKVLAYFNKYYLANNMTLSVVGEIKGWEKLIRDNFDLKSGRVSPLKKVKEPKALKNQEKIEKKPVTNNYAVLAFKTVPRGHPDSYALDVINGVLGRGQSGKMFTEIRAKKGLAYDVGTQNVCDATYGYFAIYATVDKKKIELTRKTVLEEIEKLKAISDLDLNEAKTYVEGDYILDLEDNQKQADQLLFWEQVKDARNLNNFIDNIKKVNKSDIRRILNKYFKYHTFVVVEGK